MATTAPESFYVTGGTVPPGTPSYVERQADKELYEGLTRGEFCYVLTSRQMGKSSLMAHATARLREAGIVVVNLDLTRLGQNLTVEQWYDGLLGHLGRPLDLEDELEQFWLAHERLSPLQRWLGALHEVVLSRVPGRLVIAVDEIDTVRSLSFSTDEFFAAIRDCYNRRSQDPEFGRLTFCLLGVASPSDLIQDTRTTPFNIGKRIELTDFTEAEAAPLARGLERSPQASQVLLQRVLHWTGGHPYLTQRLCQAIAQNDTTRDAAGVDRLCHELFLSPSAREKDDNLLFVRERLLRSEAERAALLDLYAHVRAGKRVGVDDTNPLIDLLRLAGVARIAAGHLRVRNRIYEQVFDRAWIIQHMPDAELRRQRAAYRRGLLRAGAAASVIVAMMVGLTSFAWTQRNGARAASHRADRKTREAQRLATSLAGALAQERQALGVADRERRRADGEAQHAGQEAVAANQARSKADDARRRADQNATRARQQEHRAQAAGEMERAARLRGARLLYDADMQLAAKAWTDGASLRVSELLARHQPRPQEEDLRGFEWRYQWRLLNSSTATFRGHAGSVYLGALAPDGHLVTLDEDLQLRHWDPATGRVVRTVDLSREPNLYRMALSHDGRTLAVRTPAGDIRLVDTESGHLKRRLTGHAPGAIQRASSDSLRHELFSLAFSDDDKSLLSLGVFDRTARVWNVATGTETHRLEHLPDWDETSRTRDLTLSPDGKTLTFANHWDWGNFTIALYPLATGVERDRVPTLLYAHGGSTSCVAYSPDGRILASGDYGGQVALSDPVTRETSHQLDAHRATVLKLAFSPDGKTLATGGRDTVVKLWDVATGRERRVLKGHTGPITFLSFSADGKRLATGSRDGTARLWDLSRSDDTRTLSGHTNDIQGAAYSPDGKWLATAAWDRTARLWDAGTGRPVRTLPLQSWAVLCVAFSPDSRTLATGGSDSRVKLWDVATGRERRSFEGHPVSYRPWYGRLVGCLGFSPDGRWLAAGLGHPSSSPPDYEQVAKIWDLTGRQKARVLKGHHNNIRGLAFSPNSRIMVTGSQDRTVKLWRVGTWELIRTLTGFEDRVRSVAFSPDGRTVAAGCADGTIQLCDAGTGRKTLALRGHPGAVDWLCFSPDGRRLASASNEVKLWDVASGRETRTLTGHAPALFSPDGHTLVTGGADSRMQLWDAATPQQIANWPASESSRKPSESKAKVSQAGPRAALLDHRRAAGSFLEKHHWAAALRHLEPLLTAPPTHWQDRLDRGRALAWLSRWSEAEAELARAARQAPHDPELWIERGTVFAELGRWDKAAADFARAVRGGSGDPMVWYRRSLSGMGGTDTDAYRQVRIRLLACVVERKPADPNAWTERGWVQSERRQWPEAEAAFTRALRLKPDTAAAWLGRGDARAEQGRWQPAAVDLAQAAERQTEAWWNAYRHAWACLGAGDLDGYRRACADLLARFGSSKEGDTLSAMAMVCAAAPGAVADPSQPVKLAEKAFAGHGNVFGPNAYDLAALTLALYRAGQYERVLATVTQTIEASPDTDMGRCWLLRAMAHHRLGHAAEARRWLDRGLRWRPPPGNPPAWDERLLDQLIRREAQVLILGRASRARAL